VAANWQNISIVTEFNKIKGCRDVYQWARPYIKNFNVAVDVGCRQGYFALNLEEDFKKIYCFDFRDKRKEFKMNVKNYDKFVYEVVGIGDSNRITHTNSTRVGRIKERGNVVVPIKTLDNFHIMDIGFIKYDVEGFETKSIIGSMETIKRSWPVIIVEQNRGNLDAVNLLKSIGYQCLGAYQPRNMDFLLIKK
jgi:FkbM family methyltransferase